MKNKSSTPFILYVVGITVMALSVLIAIKSYIAFNGLVSEDTKILHGLYIVGIGIMLGILFIAFAELLINVKQINQKLSLLTYDTNNQKDQARG
ncbi:hypothetical protein [Vallitalea guaymasensis]|uniref:Uncharacterized protein n=1 Tax=Vallitalea guaymasensis TaxID=1185412 RepID=A0A8J8SDA7_9FIRM|nr:hypothetical protein [Vallitalea guaymasensis]QUH30280.1 hypothetical protein HYG85_15755 [Vallitalea guaymasensis]